MQADPSFAQDLLHGFDEASQYCEDGVRFTKDVVSLLRKRQAIEAEYARSLSKLHQQYRALVPESKRQPFDKTRDIFDAGSLWNTWYNVLEEMHFSSIQHTQLSTQLGQVAADPLHTGIKELDSSRKQLVGEGLRYQKMLQETYHQLSKAQTAHAQAKREADEADAAARRASENFQTKDSTVAKLETKARAAREREANANRALVTTQTMCNQVQSDHFSRLLPSVLQGLEDRETDRCIQLKKALLAATRLLRDVGQRTTSLRGALYRFVEAADVRMDIEEFIEGNCGKDPADVPVTSIVDPTLKSHLLARSIDSSKSWRDYVFVLVADDRRLYQFESDDAQHPKYVVRLPFGNRVIRPVDRSLFNRSLVFQVVTKAKTLFVACPSNQVYGRWFAALQGLCYPPRPGHPLPFRVVRNLRLGVVEAKGLARSGDYFCLIFIDNERQARTLTKRGTATPYWNERFEFIEVPYDAAELRICLHRATSHLLGFRFKLGRSESPRRNSKASAEEAGSHSAKSQKIVQSDPVAMIRIPIMPEAPGAAAKGDAWYPLVSASGETQDQGSLRLRMQCTDEYVRPHHEYDRLAELLDTGNEHLPGLLKVVDAVLEPGDRVPLCKLLMTVAHHRGQLLKMLGLLTASDVDSCSDPATLFRANTLATKAIDEFQKILCVSEGTFLQAALRVPVQTIYDLRLSCEVDPTRMNDAAKEAQANLKRLVSNTDLVWSSILHTKDKVPSPLRAVFKELKQQVDKRFPGNDAVWRHAIVGFFFLRLICPAILGPQLFGLQQHQPEDHTARTLTLISKVIQNMANNIEFGQKETYMQPMNDFIREHAQQMKEYVSDLCRCEQDPEIDFPSQDVDVVLASIHRILSNNLLADEDKVMEAADAGTERACQVLLQVLRELRPPPDDDISKVLHMEKDHIRSLRAAGTDSNAVVIRSKAGLSTLLRRSRRKTTIADEQAAEAAGTGTPSDPASPVMQRLRVPTDRVAGTDVTSDFASGEASSSSTSPMRRSGAATPFSDSAHDLGDLQALDEEDFASDASSWEEDLDSIPDYPPPALSPNAQLLLVDNSVEDEVETDL